jgi:AcrR family transcriptional regulator
MARQKIQDKQKAILEAAVEVFSSRGFWDTPTSLISKTAGIADGTLFNYFKTKDDLINEVYLEIKRELADKLLDGLAANDSFQEKMRHIWYQYIDWGVQNPEKFEVLQQIGSSYELADDVKAEGSEPFVVLQQMASQSIANGEIHDYPVDYLGALLDGQALATIRFIAINPKGQEEYKRIGFDILWDGIAL